MERSYPWGEPRDDDYPKDGETLELQMIQSFICRGYQLTVKWRSRESRYHAFVDLGSTATSYNSMGPTVKEALEGLDNYLRSVPDGSAHDGDGK